MARQTPEEIYRPFPRSEAEERACDHPGCAGAGSFKAPRSRNELDSFYWFCLEHVRDYNAAWDYFRGMSEAEIERHRRNDTVWQRPTWPLGLKTGSRQRFRGFRVDDGFGFFDEEEGKATEPPRPPSEETAALAALELDYPSTLEQVKTRYKALAKKLHPDANGGDRSAEERLKAVNHAYSLLKIRLA